MQSHVRPQTLHEAVAALRSGPARVLAGGTDLYPGAGTQLSGPILDLTAITDLRGIVAFAGGMRIGAATTWTAIAEAGLPPALHALQQAARHVGGRQIQNAGTLGGNLCNASPAADGVPPLLAADAEVELVSATGTRRMRLGSFLTGPRQTALRPGELLVAVHIPPSGLTGRSTFLKLGARSHLVISIVMVAARVVLDGGRVVSAAIAVGSCSATAQRLPLVEAALIGTTPDAAPSRIRPADVASALSPIDDIRATAAYRLTAATELVTRAVVEVAR
ncbi:MAG: FAD binding domain-containing protein [Tabrizicola sp.]|uniref:FAD binding domain-containing protein n=1 Tax=Tabrizicola sp. TaxID=2005166 RepID=UPI002735CBCF|nr:FAD binding domain-containing protein [Tabrizicola sp.]MDP3264559.1 FAD binding domain-containing protein [Tabrizicola sp.]MDP3649461.1 FAD binding domain-containing protein [Paracoccaceae bacterium]MDZ4067797.1 FAD binding domain-containing protein [Tabrizicola sp.]